MASVAWHITTCRPEVTPRKKKKKIWKKQADAILMSEALKVNIVNCVHKRLKDLGLFCLELCFLTENETNKTKKKVKLMFVCVLWASKRKGSDLICNKVLYWFVRNVIGESVVSWDWAGIRKHIVTKITFSVCICVGKWMRNLACLKLSYRLVGICVFT